MRLVGIISSKDGTPGAPGFRSRFSKWHRVVMDLGALTATRGTSLLAPTLTGGTTFTSPSYNWTTTSGATKYQVFRTKGGVTEALGITTATSSADGGSNVLEYFGASEPPSGIKIQYFVRALNGTDVSPPSNTIWYKGAAGLFSVGIVGPTVVGPNNYHCSFWLANVTGAATIVSYEWSGYFTSSDAQVQGTIPFSGAEFQVVVVDSQDRQGAAAIQVTYDPNNQDQCV